MAIPGRKVTPKKKQELFELIIKFGGNISKACQAANLSPKWLYTHRKEDTPEGKQFKKDLEAAVDSGMRELENECRRRAFDGCIENVYYQGNKIGEKVNYSDTLAIFLLKGQFKDKYAERRELSGKDGGPVKIASITKEMTEEEAAQIYSELVKDD